MDEYTSSRIDYVRVLFRGPVEGTERWQNSIRDMLAEKYRVTAAEMRKHCKFGTMFDGKTKKVAPYFEVWGEAADQIAYEMPMRWKDDITRLDFRTVIPDPPKDPAMLADDFMNLNGNNRRSIGFKKSPPRTKVEGRDAGGTSITIGSHESDRRLAIYKRGKERWALECQYSRQGVRELINLAWQYWSETKGITWYAAIMKCAYQRTDDHTIAVTGHTIEQWYGNDWWANQEHMYNNQESLLALMDDTWDKLDPTAKVAFYQEQIVKGGYVNLPTNVQDEVVDIIEDPELMGIHSDEEELQQHPEEDVKDLRKMFDTFDYEEFDPYSQDNW